MEVNHYEKIDCNDYGSRNVYVVLYLYCKCC